MNTLRRYTLAILLYSFFIGSGLLVLEYLGYKERHPVGSAVGVAIPSFFFFLYLAFFYQRHSEELVDWAYSSYPRLLKGRFIFSRSYCANVFGWAPGACTAFAW